MITRLRGAIPAPLKLAARRVPDYLAWTRARIVYRARYGRYFKSAIHPADEMFQFFHRSSKRSWPRAAISYLASGESMLEEVEWIFNDIRRPLSSVQNFLEFASGYGRFTRFLVCRLDPSIVTVSDIDREAVAFATRAFSVSGFPSTERAVDLHHDRRYEIVFVASLFSHLTLDQWMPWLQRLLGLLEPKGLLIFSTHGLLPQRVWGKRSHVLAPGFYFEETNETRGRLPGDFYGTAYALPEFVERFVASNHLGRIVSFYLEALYQWQDVYVLEA